MATQNEIVDGLLVLEYQSGNKKALQVLVKKWHKRLCAKAYIITQNEDIAKDIAQDSWQTIISKLHLLKNPNSFGNWSLRIVYNKCIDWTRKIGRERNLKKEIKNQPNLNDAERMYDDEMIAQLITEIKKLSVDHQFVINLFYVESKSLKEMSKILGISEGTVKSRLYHSREKLKLILKDRNYEK